MATYTEIILPTIYNNAAGTIKCFLYVDSRVSSMTVPPNTRVLSITPSREAVDRTAGTLDIDNVTVTLADDYTTYPNGYWYELIEGYPNYDVQFLFILTEGATDTFYFRGSIFRENVKWGELYISGTTFIRKVDVQLISPMYAFKNISVADLITYLTVTYNNNYLVPCNYTPDGRLLNSVLLSGVVSAMLEMSLGITQGTARLVTRGGDIKFYNAKSSSYYNPFDGYLVAQDNDSPPSGSWTNIGLFDAATGWVTKFDNCALLLESICGSLGVIPRYYYGDSNGIYQGDANDHHTIEIIVRGDKSTTKISNSKIVTSGMVSNSVMKQLNIRTQQIFLSGEYQWWVIGGIIGNNLTGSMIPQNTQFDLDVTEQFENGNIFPENNINYLYTGALHYLTTNYIACPTKTEYYNHYTDSWIEANTTADDNLAEILRDYLWNRFTTGRKEYTREYGTLAFSNGSTSTHQHLKIMARHDINDGLSTKTFYASDIKKDLTTNRATVTWVEE